MYSNLHLQSLRRIVNSTVGSSIKSGAYNKPTAAVSAMAAVPTDAELANTVTSTMVGNSAEAEEGEFETEIREMQICQLQSYVLDSYDSISCCAQEMEMLRHMDGLAREQEERRQLSKTAQYRAGTGGGGGRGGSGAMGSGEREGEGEREDERMRQLERLGRELPELPPGDGEEGEGLEYTTVNKDALGKLIMK